VSTAKLEQKKRDLTGKIAFYRRNVIEGVKCLPRYVEENGPGRAFGVVIGDIIRQNNDLEHYENELQKIRLEEAGLLSTETISGSGAQPALA
jgi:hypothetical protein